ncbi:MAG: hypothetical protein ACE5G8_10890 [Anaerolineae bacterium]
MPNSLRRCLCAVAVAGGLAAGGAIPVLAQQAGGDAPPLPNAASTAGFLLLLPLGRSLLTAATLPKAAETAPQAATGALVAWGAAGLAYFGAGFAFQFGGLAVSNPHPDFAELYWNWSPLAPSFGTGWGMIGLRGWALLGPAATPGVYDLFLRHLALLGVVTVPPAFVLYLRSRAWVLPVFGALAGTLIYPLAGNWVWSAGWLANLGINLNLGHGFVDAGLATPFAVAGTVCLAALIFLKSNPPAPPPLPADDDDFAEIPMPPAELPLLTLFGLGMVLWGWAFAANAQHIPTATAIAMPRAALNGILAAVAGSVLAVFYSHLTTTTYNTLMTVRGGLAGLALVGAAAPFIPPWQAVAAGALAGLALPALIYTVDHLLKLNDHTAGVAAFGVMGVLGWLLVALLADGSGGAGWNGVGAETYLGVPGQGVSGLVVAPHFAADWPGQLNAQLLGAAAIMAWAFVLPAGLFKFEAWLSKRGQSKTKTAPPPPDTPGDDAAPEPEGVKPPPSA